MPPKAVKTVRDLIFWEYAKLVAQSADKEGEYGFIMRVFQDFRSGKREWSAILREDTLMLKQGVQQCVYCGSTSDLTMDHIIPQRIKAPPECDVHKVHNLVCCCRSCNSKKGGRDVQTWYGLEDRGDIPRLVRGKFLKLVYKCHECRGTLTRTDVDMDGKLDVMDLGAIFSTPCPGVRSNAGS